MASDLNDGAGLHEDRYEYVVCPYDSGVETGSGIEIWAKSADKGGSGVVVFVSAEGDGTVGTVAREGRATIRDDAGSDIAWSVTDTGGGVAVTVARGRGVDLFAQHQRNRGALPELYPPADPRGGVGAGGPDRPRYLDREIGNETAEKFVRALLAEPLWYAVTFPETTGAETYVRALADRDSIRDDWDSDKKFVAVRRREGSDKWEKRWCDSEYFSGRMLREPAVRLAHREDVPKLIYPEHYR